MKIGERCVGRRTSGRGEERRTRVILIRVLYTHVKVSTNEGLF